MKENEQRAAAKAFAETWKGRGYEKGETQPFWIELLRTVYGVEHPEHFIVFESPVELEEKYKGYIDAMIPETHVMIEQKSLDKKLDAAIKQSDGTMLTPKQQAKRYAAELPYSKRPRWVVTSNFAEFRVYDMENPQADAETILLENLEKEYYRLQFLVNVMSRDAKKEMELSLQAGEIVGGIYKALLSEYKSPKDSESLKSLNKLCVRLVFCLYADDAGIFGRRGMFYDYLKTYPKEYMRLGLIELFKALTKQNEDRDPYIDKKLALFPYVDGGLFEDEYIEIPYFSDEFINLLLHHASEDFDWSGISPTIFGAVFESTLNPVTRRAGGMHYTSLENIHKVIDPLFLDALKKEWEEVKETTPLKAKQKRLDEFHAKLASLRFLDPACGSGNFLTETYISLRRIENEILKEKLGRDMVLGDIENPVKVSIEQFYGIEINDFAVSVAKAALWIAEAQMLQETENIVHRSLDFLPLKSYSNIVEGNALTLDWGDVVPREKLNYIMGNPPFVGKSFQAEEQKADMTKVFAGVKSFGNLDYVTSWYKVAADFMKGTGISCAFVSTNSICQGIAVPPLWKYLFGNDIVINFARRTFKWNSESSDKAAVYCIIIGFGYVPSERKILFSGENFTEAKNINAYLTDAPNVIVTDRHNPLGGVPKMIVGSFPTDGGNLVIQESEYEDFINKEPRSKKYIRLYIGPDEFIKGRKRYCLWLKDCQPQELKNMPLVLKRLEGVRQFRLNSQKAQTRSRAETPMLFAEDRQPDTNYILLPRTSSEQRRYLPIGFFSADVIAGDVIILPGATLYHFGILASNVHNAWMRAVCGRLKSDYRYSGTLVYNTLPFPPNNEKQMGKIGQTAQGIIDARAKFHGSSMAALYDEKTMPPELRKAHQANDLAVMRAYGFDTKMTEAQCVAALMEMYQKLTAMMERT